MAVRHVPGRLGRLLRLYRERAHLSQERLAQAAGLGVRTVRGLEGGHVRRPHLRSLRLLAEALDLTQDQREELYLVRASESANSPAN